MSRFDSLFFMKIIVINRTVTIYNAISNINKGAIVATDRGESESQTGDNGDALASCGRATA